MALIVVGLSFGPDHAIGAPPDQDGVQVLTRGPVHEAFAGVIAFELQPGVVVPKAPPDALDELPPDQRPAGANVAWIPGYWAWDDEEEDFLWVSGVWRFLPPGRQWIAGYWGKSDAGYQWTSGYWADAQAEEIEYLPQPPAMTNVEPVGEASAEGQTWIPGVPVWNQNAYSVRPGYWAEMQSNWQWTPAYYVQTPRGYVFVDGYWDYSVYNRGVLYAPVSFNSGVYTQPGFSYSPFYAVNPAALMVNLFLRPTYGHYYFGDYYSGNYGGMGYYPAYAYHNQQGYDPFYAQQSWLNRQDANWQQNNQTQFLNRQNNEAARPPRTLTAQNELVKAGNSKDESFVVAASVNKLAGSKESPLTFQRVTEAERKKLGQTAKEIDKHRAERQQVEAETASAPDKAAAGQTAPTKAKRLASPVVAKAPDQLGDGQAPPKIHETPKAEPKPVAQAEPKPEPKSAVKTGSKTEPKPVAKTEPKPATKPTPKAGPDPTPKAEPKAAAKPTAKTDPDPATKVEPKPAPKPTPKAGPDPTPKAEPKAAAKPAPKAEPKPAPKAEPKPAPKAEPKPAPRVEPKPTPRAEPKPAAKVEPKPAPSPESKPTPKS